MILDSLLFFILISCYLNRHFYSNLLDDKLYESYALNCHTYNEHTEFYFSFDNTSLSCCYAKRIFASHTHFIELCIF